MNYLLAGDFHGRSLKELRELEFDTLLSTGDFDHPDIIKEFMDWKRDLEEEEGSVYLVPGNHDDAVFSGQNISSGTLREQDWTVAELHRELENRPEERKLLENTLEQKKQELQIDGMNTLLVHGALEGSLRSYPGCPPEKRVFWRRLLKESYHQENFNTMKENSYSIMIRGHDHTPEYTYRENGEINSEIPDPGNKYELRSDRLHTVTHGTWFNGWYATIDTGSNNPVLRFHNLDK